MAKAKAKKGESFEDSIVRMRDEEERTWKEIAETLDVSIGKAIFTHMCATVPASEKLKGSDAQITKGIVRLRDKENMGWGEISARAGWSPGKCQKVYFEQGGETVNVGRGGRYPNGESRETIRPDLAEKLANKGSKSKAKASKATTKKAVKKSAAKKAASKSGGKSVQDMSPAQFIKHAKGKFVHVDGEKFKVADISESNGEFEVKDADGEEWGFTLEEVEKVTSR